MANVGGEEYGPFTWDQMLSMAAEGRVTPDLPVRRVNDAQWSTAVAIPGLLGGTPASNGKPAAKAPVATGKSAVKKAKPLARPPSGRPVPPVVAPPQNIPAGIPVGSPVGPAVSAPPVAALRSVGFSFDLAASPSGKHRTVKKSALDDEDVVSKKTSNMPLIVGTLGGVTALIAVLVGLIIYITMNRGRTDDKLVATNTSVEKKAVQAERGEINPGEATAEGEANAGVKKPAPAAAKTAKKEANDVRSNEAAPLAALHGIREWKNAAKLVSIKIGNAKISFNRIWLSADAGGKSARRAETSTSTTAENGVATALPAGEVGPAGGKPKYVFVEVTVANTAGAPLKYKGWNIAKTKAPFMADDQDRILKLVPSSETPEVARLTKADIPGGRAISDILVFEAPAESFEKLRLVLPQNVFYDNTTNPYLGIEFTAAVLDNEGGPPAAVPPPTGIAGDDGNDPLVSGRKIPGDPANPESLTPAESTKPEPKATAKKEVPPPKKPSLIDEINRSFEEQEKTKKMDEGKGAEPAKATESVKKSDPVKKSSTGPAKPKGKK